MQFAKWSVVPIDWPKNDWNDDDGSRLVAFKRTLQVHFVAVVRIEKIWTDEKENQISRLEVVVDLLLPFSPRLNVVIVPEIDEALTLQHAQMRIELLPQLFVPM